MTSQNQLSVRAKAYIGFVLLSGLITGLGFIVTSTYRIEDLIPVVLFTTFGILSSTITIFRRGSSPNHITYQIGSSFAYPLLLLVSPGAVCLALCAMTVSDRIVNRRRLLTTTFNVAQLWISTGIAIFVGSSFRSDFNVVGEPDLALLPASIAAIVSFAAVNHLLTMGVIGVVNRRPILQWTWITRTGSLNETLCIVSGLGMAVFWKYQPWLVFLGVIPIWVTLFMLVVLNQREQSLENREQDLRSLQELGLKLGSELDSRRLRSALLRTTTEALKAGGALLAILTPRGDGLRIQASHALGEEMPMEIPLGGFEELLSGEPVALRSFEARRQLPGISFLQAAGVLLAPLEIQGCRSGFLVLVHGVGRKPFDEQDVRRVQTLVPFVNMALSNSSLVAERKEMQSQLIQTEKMSALGMLVSGVAHELNNPLTAILGFAELLGTGETDPKKRQMSERIRSETKRAASIVQNLLTFSRKHRPERGVVDINQVIGDVLELRVYELRVNNVLLERRLDPSLPRVFVDPHQFQQVILNLITNAEQAIEGAGRNGRIAIESRLRDGQVEVEVSDNGSGIEPEHLEQVFLPFFSTKDVGRGTGLGLSICYGIIEAHGGQIDVESDLNLGTRFVIRVPPATALQTETVAPELSHAVEPLEPFRGRILVVDDEEAIVRLVTEYFMTKGWTVLAARDGEEGLMLVDELEFDVLLVDLRMPGMDGSAFFERLQSSHPKLAKRVVFATGDASRPSSASFLDGIENPVLIKPYDLSELARLAQQAVKRNGKALPRRRVERRKRRPPTASP